MASQAAEAMYAALSPQERAAVDASIAGNPNGKDDWYQNAARAGDPRAIRSGGAGQSEDFDRFNAGTLTGWAQGFYDEAASRAAGRPQFRSMRGAEGFFDKPTECPPGMGPSGPNESDPCTTKGYSEPAGGGSTTAPGAATGAAGPSQSQMQMSMLYSPLRDLLANQGHFLRQFDSKPGDGQAAVQGGIMGGGGMWWSPNQPPAQTGGLEPKPTTGAVLPTRPGQYGGINPGGLGPAQQGGIETKPTTGNVLPAAPGQYGGYNPAANTSTLTSILTPLQNQQAPVSPLASAMTPLMGGQVRRRDPLGSALGPAQQAGRWF